MSFRRDRQDTSATVFRDETRTRIVSRATVALVALLGAMLLVAPSALGANPSANLDQCANDPAPSPSTDGCNGAASQWVNGNLGASKSVYQEGDSIPYRLTFDNLPAAVNDIKNAVRQTGLL